MVEIVEFSFPYGRISHRRNTLEGCMKKRSGNMQNLRGNWAY
jgi:hypothetical protein